MFSYLSRGYGTWEGIAKLEKPDSAISPNPGNFDILPPIRRDQYQFYDQHFNHDRPYRFQEDLKLPQVPKNENAVHLPKTYSTKSGALLLYSEGCFKPGSRRLKKRQRRRRQKIEQRIRTMKDLIDLIMDYKKNGCDPLLLEQLWRHMSGNARDVQPGYSPKRYLGHLSHTFDPDQWKRLVETGSLKSFGTTDDSYLSLLPEYDNHLNHQPPPYKTMSLPPVSPSSSMLGSFTFYKQALSTGAASMVSLPSIGSENIDSVNADHISVKSAATFADSLAERLAEVESENGFKKDYETLTAKEKEDLLTQLLMDVTLHNQREVITVPVHTTEMKDMKEDQASDSTEISYVSGTKPLKSLESLQSSNSVQKASVEEKRSRTSQTMSSTSMNSVKTDRMQMSDKGSSSSKAGKRSKSSKSNIKSRSSRSVPSQSRSVCSLPPITAPRTNTPDRDDLKNISDNVSLSSSHSGLGLIAADFEVGLNDVDIEIKDSLFNLAEDALFHSEEKDLETRSIKSNESFLEHGLVDALSIQDGDSLHQFTGEAQSLKSLASIDWPGHSTERMEESLSSNGAIGGSKTVDSDLVNGVVDGAIGDVYHGDDGSRYIDDIADDVGYDIGSDDGRDGIATVFNGGGDGTRDSDGYNVNQADGPSICVIETGSPDADGHPEITLPTIDLVPAPELQAPHISLSSLQDEVRLVATEVLSRPKSGRTLTDDAEMATFLLLERMQGLLGPAITANTRVSSAAPKKVRPLGQPRNSEAKGKRRARSAEATLASRNIAPDEEQVEQVLETKEKPAEQVSGKEQELPVEGDSVKETDAKDLSIDDVVVTVETVEDTGPVEKSEPPALTATPSPEKTQQIVEDLQPEVKKEVITKPDEAKAKETAVKAGKVKKTGNGKRVAKGKKKKPANGRARNEPAKTPPFHAGLVPESKPPKGLEEKAGGARKKGKQISPDLQEKSQPKTTDKVSENETQPPETSARVDSETGEVEHGVSPVRSERSSSLAGSNAPPGGRKSVSHQDQMSRAGTGSSRSQIESPREKSPHERLSSSRDKTPSPRQKLPSPREQKACPRDRDAVFDETTNVKSENAVTDVATEPEPSPTRETSPEVELTEKQRRANARAAQRAAAAERRRLEVERKRREREEARKRAQEEEARLDTLRKESEEEMKKREEERRIQREEEERERLRLEAEQNDRARQERLMNERQRQAREEWKRKKEQLLAQRKFEEELRKERERVELEIEEERRREYAEKIAHLEEEEQQRLLEERRLEEERIKREIQEEKERREAERLRMLEERRLMEEELAAARMRQMERRSFLQTLLQDFQNLLLDQRITRAFTFSYFDIMPWFKDRWRDLEEDRPRSKRPSTKLDTVPEESEIDLEEAA